jgi:hypothetical protein
MRKVLVVLALAALVFPATAAAVDPQIAALQKQVVALQKQVAALQKQVKTLQRHIATVDDQLSLNFEGDTCLGALTADLFQGTWLTIDQQVANRSIFGPQATVNDYGNCGDLAQPDVPRPGISAVPSIAPFVPLLRWLHISL